MAVNASRLLRVRVLGKDLCNRKPTCDVCARDHVCVCVCGAGAALSHALVLGSELELDPDPSPTEGGGGFPLEIYF